MRILAIDPGPKELAWLTLDTGRITSEFAKCDSAMFVDEIAARGFTWDDHCVVESIESYGMAVGREVFETCYWIGEIRRVCKDRGIPFSLMPRREVKLALCGSVRANDSNIRRYLLDRYGKEQCKGIKKDIWSALAIATTFYDQQKLQRRIKKTA